MDVVGFLSKSSLYSHASHRITSHHTTPHHITLKDKRRNQKKRKEKKKDKVQKKRYIVMPTKRKAKAKGAGKGSEFEDGPTRLSTVMPVFNAAQTKAAQKGAIKARETFLDAGQNQQTLSACVHKILVAPKRSVQIGSFSSSSSLPSKPAPAFMLMMMI